MTKYSGIYKICNAANGKIYIGSSVDIEDRWRQHKRELRINSHVNSRLQHSWNKYGENVFVFSILELVEPSKLINKEQEYVNSMNPEYNIAKIVASPMFGRTHTKFTKKRMSESRKGNKNGFWGKVHSEDAKKKMSKWRTGRRFDKHSDETKKKMSDSHSGTKNPFYGKRHSNESKEKISRAGRGREFSLESRNKISEAGRGECHYNTKLTDRIVVEIRRLWKTGKYSQVEIGNMFGVNNKIINNVVNFRTWKHV